MPTVKKATAPEVPVTSTPQAKPKAAPKKAPAPKTPAPKAAPQAKVKAKQEPAFSDDAILVADVHVPKGSYVVLVSGSDERLDQHDIFFVPDGVTEPSDPKVQKLTSTVTLSNALSILANRAKSDMEGIAKSSADLAPDEAPDDEAPDDEAPDDVAADETDTTTADPEEDPALPEEDDEAMTAAITEANNLPVDYQVAGEQADEGDSDSIDLLEVKAGESQLDPDDYGTWTELAEALLELTLEEEPENEEPDDVDQSADNVGAKADAGDESAIEILIQAAEDRGIDPEIYVTWDALAIAIKEYDAEPKRPVKAPAKATPKKAPVPKAGKVAAVSVSDLPPGPPVREWAREQGWEVGVRGRLAPEITQAYAEAFAEATPAKIVQPAAPVKAGKVAAAKKAAGRRPGAS
jgi:hypothetical protein